MPQTEVVFYCEDNLSPPLEWIESLANTLQDKAEVRITMLEDFGSDLRRPISDKLRDGIRELRWKRQKVNYRLLYSYYDKNKAVILHGCTKKDRVEDYDIDISIKRLQNFIRDPENHTYEE